MVIHPLFSSSSGNSLLVIGDKETIMIDCGVTYKKIKEIYSDIDKVDKLFITHSHQDHISGAGVIGRKFKCDIYLSEFAYETKKSLFNNCKINIIKGGDEILTKEFKIFSFSTKHDSHDSLGFKITELSSNDKFAFVTDTGIITKLIKTSIADANIYFFESDYDEELILTYDGYDDILKERIRSPLGHLSNQQTLEYIKTLDIENTKLILLGHLSRNTNSPDQLQKRIKELLPETYYEKIKIITEPFERININGH